MNHFIQKLPQYLGREIFSFIIPNISKIEFRKHFRRSRDYYNKRCQKAYFNNEILKNEKGLFLSRICKKNGKYRYYITTEFIDEIEIEYCDSEMTIRMYEYQHIYVGKNLEFAVSSLMIQQL